MRTFLLSLMFLGCMSLGFAQEPGAMRDYPIFDTVAPIMYFPDIDPARWEGEFHLEAWVAHIRQHYELAAERREEPVSGDLGLMEEKTFVLPRPEPR